MARPANTHKGKPKPRKEKPPPPANQPLPDVRRETFAQLVAKGLGANAAYREAGYAGPRQDAHKMRHKPEVADRVRFLMGQAAGKLEIELEQWVTALVAVADFDIGELFDEQDRLKAFSAMTRRQRLMVTEVADHKDGRRVKVMSKHKALDALGRYLGAFEKDNIQRRALSDASALQGAVEERLRALGNNRLLELRQRIEGGNGHGTHQSGNQGADAPVAGCGPGSGAVEAPVPAAGGAGGQDPGPAAG